jgi:hypothetical protein
MKEAIGSVTTASTNMSNFKKKNPNATILAPGLEQHLSDATNVMNVSAYLFEKHRVISTRSILINLVHTEIKYHASAIEYLSPVLEALYNETDLSEGDLVSENVDTDNFLLE